MAAPITSSQSVPHTDKTDVALAAVAWEILKAAGLPDQTYGSFESRRRTIANAYIEVYRAITTYEKLEDKNE